MASSTCFFSDDFIASLKTLARNRRSGILVGFWPQATITGAYFDESSSASFLQYVAYELSHVQHHQRYFAVENLESTFEVVRVLRQNSAKSLKEVIQTLSTTFLNTDPESVQRSVELTVRLWLTLNVNSAAVAVGPTFPDEDPLDWAPTKSLDDLIQGQFTKGVRTGGLKGGRKIDPALTAAYLSNMCGIRLRWTDSISDHLKFDSSRQLLTVYRHKICLANHLESKAGCPIPRQVLGEILDTLNLLFPFGDVSTKQLLIKEGQQPLYGLGSCGRMRKLDLAHYEYFREELEHLIDAFNQPPKTWRQLAVDRRNKSEWAAFWITVMVAFLTLVSIPCSIIQATYSVKAYNVALAQMQGARVGEL